MIRELRVTDIRCSRCNAGPGELCKRLPDRLLHEVRELEHKRLVAAGWEWQEIDPHDEGAKE